MPTFAIHTLGCRANQSDSQRLREILCSAGFEEVDFNQPADCKIVNTCTVTREADRKSRQVIRRALKLSQTVVATGCAVADRGGLGKMPGAALRLPPEKRDEILALLGAEACPAGVEVARSLPQNRTRALLKVQDGCDQFCSFCIVPYVRGRSSSQPIEAIVKEAQRLEAQGYQELVLTGIHLAIWGHDLEKNPDLSHLVEALLENTKRVRIRLSSVEPDRFPLRLCQLMAQYPQRLCPHLHLVLQHASDRVLDRMRRGYRLADYQKIVETFFEQASNACLTSDMMVGFPGEDESDFRVLLDYVRRTPFFHLHVFPYSLRPGTTASKFADQVPPQLKSERRDRLLRLAERKKIEYLRSCYGQTLEVLVEKCVRPGWVRGVAANYVPVEFRGGPPLAGRLVKVQVERRRGGVLRGRAVGQEFEQWA